MERELVVDGMNPEDWDAVREIYLEGIATGDATFQQTAPTWTEWDESHLSSCRLVVRSGETVLGWAALSLVSNRCVYAGVAEVSVYVRQSQRSNGLGSLLLRKLIQESEQHGFWTLQSGIFPENEASIRLHQKHGFREVGRRERIGQMNGIWRDVLLLERRSAVVGIV